MKLFVLTLITFIRSLCIAQKSDDTKIIVSISDSLGSYEKAKSALVKNNFIVKEDSSKRTISTYPREFDNMPGYAIANAEISGDTIVISGLYGLKKLNYWGFAKQPKDYKPIIYFKGSKGWRLLVQVANDIGGNISYGR